MDDKNYRELTHFIGDQFKEVRKENKELTDFMSNQFQEVWKRFDRVDKEFNRVWDEFAHVHASSSSSIYHDVSEIRRNFVSRIELDDVLARLSLVEKKLKIKSGKSSK